MFSSEEMKNELVEVLESVAYMICKDDDITSDIFYEVEEILFYNIFLKISHSDFCWKMCFFSIFERFSGIFIYCSSF